MIEVWRKIKLLIYLKKSNLKKYYFNLLNIFVILFQYKIKVEI